MCLEATYKSTKKFLAKLKKQKKTWFYVYKPVRFRPHLGWTTLFQQTMIPEKGEFVSDRQEKGINKVDNDILEVGYDIVDFNNDILKVSTWSIHKGIHGFLHLKDTKEYMIYEDFRTSDDDILRCKARVKDVVAAGSFANCPSCALMKVEVCPDSYKRLLAKNSPKKKISKKKG